ncbi:MAG: hypothetical protein EPN26_06925 [Rhodospirillales bacterium]|nr:MAG: hypothetical protein EPN26_06925 [Rhodospirillales bacterium]
MTKTPWYHEFKAEIERDARELRAARAERPPERWSYEKAVARTRQFYLDRITGYATCLSITETERDELLKLLEIL